MKVALIGGVSSTRVALEKLIQHSLAPECVYGYEPQDVSTVSGYANLRPSCKERSIDYASFQRISDRTDDIASHGYDLIFVVGLSQLVSDKIISSTRLGCIGFHPTLLPRGRGRAPIAWSVLEENAGAANLFLIDHHADAGPIFKQVPFTIAPSDDAQTVERKALDALALALDEWLPSLKAGEWNPTPQNEWLSTEYGRRAPEDGWIDWNRDAYTIDRLIKASTRPHPGAYSFLKGRKLIAWKSEIESSLRIKGVIGRILKISDDGHLLVQTGSGLLWIVEYSVENDEVPRVGMRLGYYHELEIYEMRCELEQIKNRLGI